MKPKPVEWELYDVAADRSGKHDITAEHAEVVSRMKAELENLQSSVIRSYNGGDYGEKINRASSFNHPAKS